MRFLAAPSISALVPAALASLLAFACGDDTSSDDGPPDVVVDATPITSVRAPDPLLVGSPIAVEVGVGAIDRNAAALIVRADGEQLAVLQPGVPLEFEASASLVDALSGGRDVALSLDDGSEVSDVWATRWSGARSVAASLSGVASAPAYYGQPVVLVGSGFAAPSEGEVRARFSGTFTPRDGTAEPIDILANIEPAERFARDRGVVRIPSALGGLREGDVEGTLGFEVTFASGAVETAAAVPLSFGLLPPEVFRVEDDSLWLGERVTFAGGGFVDEAGVSTLVRLDGTFTGFGSPAPVDALEIVLDQASGDNGAFVLRARDQDGRLVNEYFEASQGTFDGTVTVTTTDGVHVLTGSAAPVSFELLGVRQVVWLRFLPGFYDSLDLFGLGAAAGAIETRVAERIREFYEGLAVDVRLVEPADVDSNHVTRIDLGGPDPNGIGLFGFDNTPGKDVGNLRLFDVIGGANFETQADGYPGYGGVFIESMIWWSADPPGDGERPNGAPAVDPDFDAVFQPVFERAATPSEVLGEGDAARVAEVALAVRSLANVIGETAAHELGHSFGLAEPGNPNAFHNAGDTPGCLMDHGADRPFGERAGLEGHAPTEWCGAAYGYLESILPLD